MCPGTDITEDSDEEPFDETLEDQLQEADDEVHSEGDIGSRLINGRPKPRNEGIKYKVTEMRLIVAVDFNPINTSFLRGSGT